MAALRIYSRDVNWYRSYICKMLQEAHEGYCPAVGRLRSHVPRFAERSDADVASGAPTLEDGQLVCAREHGFDTWETMADRVEALRKGEAYDPYEAVIHAIEGGNLGKIREIILSDPGLVHEVGTTGKTPLHSAADSRVVQFLVEQGAPVDKEVLGAGGTALVHALHWGRVDKSELLADHSLAPGNMRVAAGLGRMDLLASLFCEDGSLAPAAGARRAFYRPNYGWYPWATSDDPQEILDEALSYAGRCSRIEAMEYLIERGADVNGVTYLAPPLHYTVWKGSVRAIRWLIEKGTDVSSLGSFGGHAERVTAMHLAAQDGRLDVVKLLVDAGIDVTVKDALYDGTALGWARHFKKEEVAGYLETVPGLK